MKIKLLLIVALSSFSSIHAMWTLTIEERRTGLRFPHLREDSYMYGAIILPKLDITKKLTLQEQSLYDQGLDQGKVHFPYALKNYIECFKGIEQFDEKQVLPIPEAIDQKTLDKISKILWEAKQAIESASGISKKAWFNITTDVVLHKMEPQDRIKLINAVKVLSITKLFSALKIEKDNQNKNI